MVQEAVADPAAGATQADPAVVAADPSLGQVAVEGAGQAGAADLGAVEEAPKPLSLAEIPDDDLIAQLRERRNGEGLSLEDRLRKSERDKYEAERKRDAGKIESVARRTARFLDKHGLDPSDVDRSDIGELNALSYYAHQDALGDLGRAWVQATADEFGVTDRTLITEALSRFQDDPTGIDDLASKVLLSVKESVRTNTLSTASLADVPDGSKLRADINAEAQRLADAELTARALAGKQKESLPVAPSGAPSANDDERFRSMTAGEVSMLPPGDYRAWQTWRGKQP